MIIDYFIDAFYESYRKHLLIGKQGLGLKK